QLPPATSAHGAMVARLSAQGNVRRSEREIATSHVRRHERCVQAQVVDWKTSTVIGSRPVASTALTSHEHHGTELAALPHRGEHVARAQQRLSVLIRDLLTDAARTGNVRGDIAPAELASYRLHALAAASGL